MSKLIFILWRFDRFRERYRSVIDLVIAVLFLYAAYQLCTVLNLMARVQVALVHEVFPHGLPAGVL